MKGVPVYRYSFATDSVFLSFRFSVHVGEDPVFSDDEPDEVEQSAEEMDDDADDDDLKDNNHKEDGDGDEESDASGGSPDVGAYKKQKRSSKSKHNNTPPPPASVKLDMRAKFASNLLLLNGMDLGHVIDILERECPEALESIGQQQHQQHPKPTLPDRLEINLDKIELGDVFQKVSTYAAEHARARKRTAPPPPKIKDVSNRRRDRK